MRKSVLIGSSCMLALAFATYAFITIPSSYELHWRSLQVGGAEREYLLFAPTIPDEPRPLVLVFHGGGGPLGSAELMAERSGWAEKARAERFLVAFGQGTLDDPTKPFVLEGSSRNIRTWSDGSNVTGSSLKGVNDVAYTRAMLDQIASEHPIDLGRVYATGFSNGATFTYYLGTRFSERLAAIAPVAGLLYVDATRLEQPVSLLHIVGADDPPPGREKQSAGTQGPKVTQAARRWATYLKCPPDPTLSEHGPVTTMRWKSCDGDAEVVEMIVEGMRHVFPGEGKWFEASPNADAIATVDVVWEFFQRHHSAAK